VNLLQKYEHQSKLFYLSIGFTLIGIIGVSDFLTGYELTLSEFYVIPIAFITWFMSRRLGLVASLTSALVWLVADLSAGHAYANPLVPFWNSLILFSFFVMITLLLSSLRNSILLEREYSRTDYLTGAANARLFSELASLEIERLRRYGRSFSLAYFDIDDFKNINDRYGHSTGDEVLRSVASCVKQHLRKTDLVARLGGDEFALLLPETDQASARQVLQKIQSMLLEEMHTHDWPITFSIGVITCKRAPHTPDELVKMADESMYSVKRAGKNAIKYIEFTGEPRLS
jgi:diguanylate cyclase (GGDEF)-like protein